MDDLVILGLGGLGMATVVTVAGIAFSDHDKPKCPECPPPQVESGSSFSFDNVMMITNHAATSSSIQALQRCMTEAGLVTRSKPEDR